MDEQAVLEASRTWVQRWVIGEGLCPFAKVPWEAGRVRMSVCMARDLDGVVASLHQELVDLHASDAQAVETTLLITPLVLQDFLDFNDFLEIASAVLVAEQLQDDYQIASFHPQYQFQGTKPQDRANYSNRSPYPILQILRQESINQGLSHVTDPASIYQRNIAHLRGLDDRSWERLCRGSSHTK